MDSQNLVEQLTVQSDVISRLIQEAEESVDEGQRFLLYGAARNECDKFSRSLRSYLSRKLPGHQLNAA